MKTERRFWSLGALGFGSLILVFCGAACFLLRSELPSRSFRSMGGLATVTLGASYSERIEPVTKQAQGIFDRLESEMSTYRADSAISLLAERAGVDPVPISDDAYRVLRFSQHFGDLSDGAFDITVAPLVTLWGFGRTPAIDTMPSPEMIRERLRLVGYRRLVLTEKSAFLPVKGMAIDLGGIAKGYAVDRAYEFCKAAGIEDFLIDLSGNIRVSGRPRWGENWEIGVRDPFDRSRVIGKLTLMSGMAVATSGNYERFVEIEGQRYSHIIDPRTGYPVAGTAGVTVLCDDATTADGLSTSFFVEGLKGAGKLLQKSSADVLIIPDRYPIEIWVTPGFAQAFQPIPELSQAVRLIQPAASP